MPKLIVVKGPDSGKQFPLIGSVVTAGRHSGNSIHLRDDRVSRWHLELRETASGYRLIDLGSGNGTRVNGRVLREADLQPGDQIGIGESLLLYASDVRSAAVPSPSPREPSDGSARLVISGQVERPSAILRTVAEDAGSEILTRPGSTTDDWLRNRLAHLAVLYEATSAVSHILDVEDLLRRVVDLVVRTTEADHGCAIEIDADTGDLKPKAFVSRRAAITATEPGQFVVSRTVIEYVLKNKQGVLVADAESDDRFRSGESVTRHHLREVICVPMKGRHETVGVLFLDTAGHSATTQPTKFTEDHLKLSAAVAHQAALAVEETRYYQALLQSERLAAVGQTIAALSHHIKNIMQGVRFGSDMVRMALGSGDSELLVKGWRMVEKNQERIEGLILDMLSYSKDREPALEQTDLNGLVAEVLDVVSGRAEEEGVVLQWTPAEGFPPIPCDPDGIQKALLNVASNAVDAAAGRPNARVTVGLALDPTGNYAELTVDDNGPGIPPHLTEEIFKPFVSTKGSRGTGLGLPVSRKILREHGGDVSVTSESGRGTRFVLQIPIRSQP